jgi:phage tail-like protein
MIGTSKFQFVIRGPGGEAENFTIPTGITIIGRQAGVDLLLKQSLVSRQHAQIYCNGVECYITDLSSANGTRIDGEKLTPQEPKLLLDQSMITIGEFELRFERSPGVTDELPQVHSSEGVEFPAAVPGRIMAGKGPPPEEPPNEWSSAQGEESPAEEDLYPPGLIIDGQRLLSFLPEIYHTDFMVRFLGIFESILYPVEWNIDNFDLYLAPGTSPRSYLIWLAKWFGIHFDSTWSLPQRRVLLSEAHQLFAERGTPWALKRVLEIYLQVEPQIVDQDEGLEPYTFKVFLPVKESEVKREIIEQLINDFKPAYTSYSLEFKR